VLISTYECPIFQPTTILVGQYKCRPLFSRNNGAHLNKLLGGQVKSIESETKTLQIVQSIGWLNFLVFAALLFTGIQPAWLAYIGIFVALIVMIIGTAFFYWGYDKVFAHIDSTVARKSFSPYIVGTLLLLSVAGLFVVMIGVAIIAK